MEQFKKMILNINHAAVINAINNACGVRIYELLEKIKANLA